MRTRTSLCSQRNDTHRERCWRVANGQVVGWELVEALIYFGGGGGGLGQPVVSYAPRPMLVDSHSRSIILLVVNVVSKEIQCRMSAAAEKWPVRGWPVG